MCYYEFPVVSDSYDVIHHHVRVSVAVPPDEFDRCRGPAPTERAKSLTQCNYYDFLKTPTLRPADPVQEQVFLSTIARFRSQLAKLDIINGLNDGQQDELAALVVDFTAKYEMCKGHKDVVKGLRELPGLLGIRKMGKLEKAVGIIRSITASLPSHNPFIERRRLEDSVQSADTFKTSTPYATAESVRNLIESTREIHPQPVDPAPEVTCQLFWYFVCKCGLAKNEAEVRTAKVGNRFFGWAIEVTEKYDGTEQWKGSTTIRQRITRHCPARHKASE